MARSDGNPVEMLTLAGEMFDTIGVEADQLATGEQTGERLPTAQETARKWQKVSREVSAKVNSAAPGVPGDSNELLRGTSLMLAEIIGAQTPDLTLQRYHARRSEIETSLAELRRVVLSN